MDTNKVTIFDTTMRDGEQAPGATMNKGEKLKMAHQLGLLGVDVIEAGFAANSTDEIEAIAAVAQQIREPVICSLARTVPKDIDAAWQALKQAKRARIHVFTSGSDLHLAHMLRKSRQEVLDSTVAAVKHAKQYVEDVEFSPQDATRSDIEFLIDLFTAAIDAGATTINVPDTVGYAIPQEFEGLIRSLIQRIPNSSKAIVSVHCHNDLGLSTANSLAAIRAGARQVEVCINGIGERAGNAALEEVVMGIHTRRDYLGVEHSLDTTQIARTSRTFTDITGISAQVNKAIVGANAFRHESGIHQDGVLKERTTYEIMDPQDIGLSGNIIHLGKTSGRAGFRSHLESLGYHLSDDEFNKAWNSFKELVSKKKYVDDRDVEALVAEEMRTVAENYRLEQLNVTCGEPGIPTASVKVVSMDGQEWVESAVGDGPVDAVYKALSRVVDIPNQLEEYSVKSITESTEAQGEVTIRIRSDGKTFTGRGVSTDIIVASAKAYLNAINRVVESRNAPELVTSG